MGIYDDIILERKQQVEKVLGVPYDGSRYQSPSDCPPGTLNAIADIKVMEAEERQIEIREEIGGTGLLRVVGVPADKKPLLEEADRIKKTIELWAPHMSPGRKKAG